MKNKMPIKYLAKPTLDISVDEHQKHVEDEALKILASRPFLQKKYKDIVNKDLLKRVQLAARYHDVGKKYQKWQLACQKDHDIFKKTNNRSNMKFLRNAKFRHEIATLTHPDLQILPFPVKVAIGAHHSKLAESEEHRWEKEIPKAKEIWHNFKGMKYEVLNKIPKYEQFEKALLLRYEYAGPRSLLQLADHRASATEEGQKIPALLPFKYEFPKEYKTKRGVQKIIDELKDDSFSVLRAPTGSGKTDAALLWAKHQIENEKADRLVIAMPTRFTANALSISTAEKLSQVGLYHSSSWFQRISDGKEITFEEKSLIDKEQDLARLLVTPITVTTIDHLCISLTGTREDHHSIFFNLANSCVVIDEADFYDDFTQHNILILLKALQLLNVPILLMSATVPKSSLEFYSQAGCNLSNIYEDKSDIKRIRCQITNVDDLSISNDIESILQKGIDGTPLIIYANTVNRAQEYFNWFYNQAPFFTDNNIVLYHSRFTEPDKAAIEEKLSKMLGQKAWAKGSQFGIAILTQIGELSVNISADLMISDICPIDRLVQRAGRLSRFSTNKGNLYIVKPMKKDNNCSSYFYCAPYGNYQNGSWQVSSILEKSMNLLCENEYSSKMFVDLVEKIYPKMEVGSSASTLNNMEELKKLFISNWLILPATQLEQDDSNTSEWKSRDIPPQFTVYVNVDLFNNDYFFKNKSEFKQFEIRHGVQCYNYEFYKAKNNGFIEPATFYIGEDYELKLWIVKRSYYSSVTGLSFKDLEN
ncbi:MAG: CRISPR-associated helicase Cas3' [Melioribacteraceae bacterium]|nr:CRISPR-associated helicase Cas3' [Melioribacteraceae bacterium]